MRPIGGEFEISSASLRVGSPTMPPQPASGRAALFQILRHALAGRAGAHVALPRYLCESVVHAVTAAGFIPCFYDVTRDLRADRADLSRVLASGPAAVMFISYFGLVDSADDIAFAKDAGPETIVIQDDVHSPFERRDPTGAHYAFTSLRKALPVVDGAPVTPRLPVPLDASPAPFSFAKLAGAFAKHARAPDGAFLRLLADGEQMLDLAASYSGAMSWMSASLLASLDLDDIAKQRRENFRTLEAAIAPLGLESIVPLDGRRVPLFLPVRVQDRDRVRRGLAARGMFCPAHWPRPHGHDDALAPARRLYDSELSLIIDQRYDGSDMERIAEALRDLDASSDRTEA